MQNNNTLVPSNPAASIMTHFESLTEPRQSGKVEHKLIDIIIITTCAVICGANNWVEVAEFGKERENWLRKFLELPNGIPSHDTFGRVFSVLSSTEFHNCFVSWIEAVFFITKGQVIAIDGKTLRKSYERASNKAAIHMVSAWATANRVVLGQVKTSEKSNEITTIPELLKLLEIKGCIITIDAMGCQKAIAEQIIAKGGDYIFGLKGNHSNLYEDVKLFFEDALEEEFKDTPHSYHEDIDAGHGRIETRRVWSVSDLDWLEGKEKWKGLNVIGMVESTREIEDKISTERRFYIGSIENDAKLLGDSIRAHWGIENTLHWSLDVNFREDYCRVRKGNASENFSVVRHIALGLLQQEKTAKVGIEAKRFKCALNTDYLTKILSVN